MAKQAEPMLDDTWSAWEADENEQGWLLSYVDVLSVILAMLLVLLVNSLRSGESASPAEVAEEVPPPQVPVLAGEPPASLPFALYSPLPASLPPPPAMVIPESMLLGKNQVLDDLTLLEDFAPAEVASDEPAATIDGVEVVRHDTGVTLKIAEIVLFDSSRARLKNTAGPVLERAVLLLREFGEVTVAVQGHTDDRPVRGGSYRSNWELASARANAVAEFLLEQGFPPAQLRVESYADTHPVAENSTEAGRAQNRRVELLVEFEEGELSSD